MPIPQGMIGSLVVVLEGRPVVTLVSHVPQWVVVSLISHSPQWGSYLDGVVTLGCFARQHNAVSSIKHSVGDVRRLGACRPRLPNHALQHLSRTDHGLASTITSADHHLLCKEYLQQRQQNNEYLAAVWTKRSRLERASTKWSILCQSINQSINQHLHSGKQTLIMFNRFTALLEYVRDHPGEQVPER